MSILTEALYTLFAGDATLIAMLSTYKGNPAVFTSAPPPEDAELPYIVTIGDVSAVPDDTKVSGGRSIIRDVRCYDEASGSSELIESIAERVRQLLHRQEIDLTGEGFNWILSDVSGPSVADERDAQGRILTLSVIAQED